MPAAQRTHRLEHMPRSRQFRSPDEWEQALEKWLVEYERSVREQALDYLLEGRILESHWQRAFLYDDFIGNGLEAKWTTSVTSGGTVTLLTTAHDVRLDAGGTASATARLYGGNTQIQGDNFRFLCRIKLNSTANNIFAAGLASEVTTTANFVYFEYPDSATGWVARTNGGTATTTTNISADAGADTNYHFLGIFAQPTRVRFYFDGRLLATHTDNIPTAKLFVRFSSVNPAANPPANNRVDVDFVKVWEPRIVSGAEIEERGIPFL